MNTIIRQILALVILSSPLYADLSVPLQATANAALTVAVSSSSARQSQYLASNGRYFQGIRTRDSIPAGGATSAPDLSKKPTDQAHDWTDFGIQLNPVLPIALQIDIYDGPSGQGYVVKGFIVETGVTYCRSVNVGPETWRTHDWTECI